MNSSQFAGTRSNRNVSTAPARAARGGLWLAILCATAVQAGGATTGVDPLPTGTAAMWAEAAVRNEVSILQQQGSFSMRHRERKVDAKGDTTRIIIDSKDGGVGRLIERNGQPITAAEDAAERARLQDALDHPGDFLRHHRHDGSNRADAIQLIQLMPQAMVNVFTPGQPQLAGVPGKQVVLDFHPNPDFHPPGMMADLLTGIEGRVWIDEATQRIVRIEGRVLRPVNFGFGVVARIYPGGTLEMDQTQADGRWVYTHLEQHLSVRVAMVKTLPDDVRISSSDFQMLPSAVPFQQAIRELLSMPVQTR